MTLSLEQLQTADESHPKQLGTFSQSLAKILSEGQYRVKFKDGSAVNQANHALLAPKSYLTIAYAMPEVETEYSKAWAGVSNCEASKHNFPLALKQ